MVTAAGEFMLLLDAKYDVENKVEFLEFDSIATRSTIGSYESFKSVQLKSIKCKNFKKIFFNLDESEGH